MSIFAGAYELTPTPNIPPGVLDAMLAIDDALDRAKADLYRQIAYKPLLPGYAWDIELESPTDPFDYNHGRNIPTELKLTARPVWVGLPEGEHDHG